MVVSCLAVADFGCGCFWHVQHEFVEAEKRILGRSDTELTTLAGYAGGLAGTKDGKVCYHNAAQISDYGGLGHAEVVKLRIPPASYPEFAAEYVKLLCPPSGSNPRPALSYETPRTCLARVDDTHVSARPV